MKVKEIVKTWLIENRYDGLYADGGECACEVNDLEPCSCIQDDCLSGYKKTWEQLTEKEKHNLSNECDFYIVKEPKDAKRD